MQAVLNGVVIAEAPQAELIKIEGNWYFPPASVKTEFLTKSPTPYTCSWKGVCQFFTVSDGVTSYNDRAFSYPEPIPASFERVGSDYSNYVAFWKEVQLTE